MAMLDRQEQKPVDSDLIEIRSNPVPRYFAFLFLGLLVWGVLFIGYFLMSGWSSQEEFARKMESHQQQVERSRESAQVSAAAASPEAQHAAGEKLYAQNCSACHGEGGGGGIGPALKTAEYKYGKGLEEVKTSIASGRPEGMPGFANQLSAQQVETLARYLISL